MSAIRHPNVVLFMGVCLDPPCMVTEVKGWLLLDADPLSDPESLWHVSFHCDSNVVLLAAQEKCLLSLTSLCMSFARAAAAAEERTALLCVHAIVKLGPNNVSCCCSSAQGDPCLMFSPRPAPLPY